MARFQKGMSGNPKGRPKKGLTMTDILNEYLDRKTGEDENVTYKQRVIRKVVEIAEEGDIQALKYIFDRIDGRPIETVRVDSDSSRPIVFPEGFKLEVKPEAD